MMPSMMHWSFPPNWNICRRELGIAFDLVGACAIAYLFIDRSLAVLVSKYGNSQVLRALNLIPDRVQISFLIFLTMVVLIAYRMSSGDYFSTDRSMFVLGCGVVAGFVADKLKVVFGRTPPSAWLTEGSDGFHFFSGGYGLDAFPSSHAAIAAAIAGATWLIWPAHRSIVFVAAGVVVASRFMSGAHYLSDALAGCAVGLAIVVLMQILFYKCGIHLETINPGKK